MGAKSSTAKGLDLNVTTYGLAEAAQRASGMAVWTDGKILIGHSSTVLQLDLSTKTPILFAGKISVFGSSNGHRLDQAQFQNVADLLVVQNEDSLLSSLYIIDSYNCTVKLLENDIVSTYAGTGEQSVRDGPRLKASFFYPVEIIKIGPQLFISDLGTHCIRIISPDGMVSTLRNQPTDAKWRWKSLLNPSPSSLRSNSILGSSSDSQPKYQPLKQTGESHPDLFFDETNEGLVKFGTLRAIASSHPECPSRKLYVADEIKKNGRSINRLLRFDLERKEVEILMTSFVKDKSALTTSSSGGKVYEGGKVVSKDLTSITGLIVVSVTEQGEDELIMATDRDRNAIFSIRIKEGEGGSMMKVVGKDTDAHGGHKDGSLKTAKLEGPSRPSITPQGHMIWLDGNDKGHSRLRCVRGFAQSMTTLREEMKMFLARQQALQNPTGTSGASSSSQTSTPSKSPGVDPDDAARGTKSQLEANQDDSDENVRATMDGCLFRPSAGPVNPSGVTNVMNTSMSSYGGSLDSSSFYSIASTSPPVSPSSPGVLPYQAQSMHLPSQASANQKGKTPATPSSSFQTSPGSQTTSSQYGSLNSITPPTSPSVPSPFLVTKPSSTIIPPHQPTSPRLQQHHDKSTSSNSTDSIPYVPRGDGHSATAQNRAWTSGNSTLYSAQKSPSQQHLLNPTYASGTGSPAYLSQSTGIPGTGNRNAFNGSTSSIPLTYSSTSSISSLTSSTNLTHSTSLATGSTTTLTSPTAPLSFDSIVSSSSGTQGAHVQPLLESPSHERLAHHRERSRPDLLGTTEWTPSQTHSILLPHLIHGEVSPGRRSPHSPGETPTSPHMKDASTELPFNTATSPRSSLANSVLIPVPSSKEHQVISLPSATFSLNPFDLESNWTLIESGRPSSPTIPLSSSPHH